MMIPIRGCFKHPPFFCNVQTARELSPDAEYITLIGPPGIVATGMLKQFHFCSSPFNLQMIQLDHLINFRCLSSVISNACIKWKNCVNTVEIDAKSLTLWKSKAYHTKEDVEICWHITNETTKEWQQVTSWLTKHNGSHANAKRLMGRIKAMLME